MELFRVSVDKVIGGFVVSGVTNYEFALSNFLPLMGRLDIQRDALKTKFYSRLEADIVKGCVMPPITIALVNDFDEHATHSDVVEFIKNNIDNGFVLDGIQRLNTLRRAAKSDGFNSDLDFYVNFIVAKSRDRLLYRMITLNNGQRPMSARHQIDILADSFFDFSGVPLNLIPEKSNGRVRAPDAFKKADFVKGYIAYLSGSLTIDNQKIIEEKMDELIANKIIESDILESKIEFSDLVVFINKLSVSAYLREWIRVQNNFIGFCVGVRSSFGLISSISTDEIESAVKIFEEAFSSVNVSKVNLGKVRRQCVSKFIAHIEEVAQMDELALLDKISDWIQ